MVKHKGTQKIETKRLLLRPFIINDAESMYNNWASDPEVSKHTSWKFHNDIKTTERLLKEWTDQYINADYYQWAITLKSDLNQPLGSISVVAKDDVVRSMSVGYCIGTNWWKKGIATEALNAVLKFLFQEVNINRVSATYLPENPASGRVMEKCNFKYEGTLREATWSHTNGVSDVVIYSILARDYK